jgi:phage gp36-like protein
MAQYATAADLAVLGLPAAALVNIPAATQDDHLEKASGLIDSYLRAQHTLPLAVPYPDEVVRACVVITAYDLIQFRGYNPDEYDANFRLRYEDTIRWCEQLAAGTVSLSQTADATGTVNEGRPRVITAGANVLNGTGTPNTLRGW